MKKKVEKKRYDRMAGQLPTLVLFTFFVWEPLLENIRISLQCKGI